MEAKARLFLNADRDKLLPEGHEEAAFLYAAPGDEIPDEAAERFGLVDGDLPKGGKAPANKAAGGPAENKGAAGGEAAKGAAA